MQYRSMMELVKIYFLFYISLFCSIRHLEL